MEGGWHVGGGMACEGERAGIAFAAICVRGSSTPNVPVTCLPLLTTQSLGHGMLLQLCGAQGM